MLQLSFWEVVFAAFIGQAVALLIVGVVVALIVKRLIGVVQEEMASALTSPSMDDMLGSVGGMMGGGVAQTPADDGADLDGKPDFEDLQSEVEE